MGAIRRFRRTRLLISGAVIAAVVATAVPTTPAEAEYRYNGAGVAAQVGIITDSALTGIRWYNQYGPLRRYNFIFDGESCRRTIHASCRSREGYVSDNTITTMRKFAGQWGDVLVIATGYNDPGSTFGQAVDTIMAEAARQGISKVVWLTMRTASVTYVGPGFSSNSSTFRDNNRILLSKAQQYAGRLFVADWATYSANHPEWVTSDGIHMTRTGAWAAAEFIASQVSRVLGGENVTYTPTQSTPRWSGLSIGANNSNVAAAQRALIDAGYNLRGGADGVYGAFTAEAVRQFQRDQGLPITGVIDTHTAIRLGIYRPAGIPNSPGWTELRLHGGGRAVAEAQQALIDHGIHVAGGVTGVFNVWTFYAINTFQRLNGLPVTGRVDAATARALGLYSGAWYGLRRGSTGTRVEAAQRALSARGISLGSDRTGVFGLGTYYAVRTFQRWQGLPDTGVIDAETARLLLIHGAPAASDVWTPLARGMQSNRVERAQHALMARGIHVAGGVTGVFDVFTFYAVNTFQRLNNLPVTGVIDMRTARALGLFDVANPVSGWSELRLWSAGPSVANAQAALMGRGVFVRGGASGVFDIYTYYAVNTFQRLNGLPVNGAVDIRTARALGLLSGSNPALAWRRLAMGSTGNGVRQAQQALMARGVFVRGGATGVFDIYTYYAVNTFQRHNGLPVTGVIDVWTAQKLGLFGMTTASIPATATATATASAPATATAMATAMAVEVDEPVETEPVDSEPAATEPVETEPVETEPVASEPVASEPVEIEPGDAAIGGVVWLDADGNGYRGDGEPLLERIVVTLLDADDVAVAQTITNRDGEYEFAGLDGGSYRVEIELPADHTITTAHAVADTERDSDAIEVVDEGDGVERARTDVLTLDAGPEQFVDVGLVPDVPATTEPPATSPPPQTDPPATAPPPTEPPATDPPATTPPAEPEPEPTEAGSADPTDPPD